MACLPENWSALAAKLVDSVFPKSDGSDFLSSIMYMIKMEFTTI